MIPFALVASISCSSEEVDPHGHIDAGGSVVDVTARDAATELAVPLDRSNDESSATDVATDDAAESGVSDAADAGGAACTPACDVDQICCTDQHGHFPTCRAGTSCPDAGTP